MRGALVGALAALALALPAGAAEWRAIDGDTIKLVEPIDGTKRVRTVRVVRLWGIDAPEAGHRARCPRERDLADAARAEVARLLAEAARVRIDRREVREKYGRELAGVLAVRRDGTTVNVGAHLVDIGLARPWLGHGKRPDWCGGAG